MVELSKQLERNDHLQVNCRVRLQGHLGTVRYVGEVTGHPGVWVGVEWDDPTRGKHDGQVNGVRYFQTTHPTAASMVRLEKVSRFQSLEAAILERYYELDANPLDEGLLKEVQAYIHAPLFEIVGMEKLIAQQGHLEQLAEVSVSGADINCAGDLRQFRSVVSLDVSSTLVWNWHIVADIVKQLPALDELSLANTRLQLPAEDEIATLKPYFDQLRSINLRNCGLSRWEDVLRLARLWPDVEYLSLQDNQLARIGIKPNKDVFQRLQKLDLQENELADFNDVAQLGHVKSLKELLLMNNRFTRLKLPACRADEQLDLFVGLETLNLRENPLADEFEVFNELDKLPALRVLSVTPSAAAGYDETFSRAVGMIGGLRVLNRTDITKTDRRNAEYDIWKKFTLRWLETDADQEARTQFVDTVRVYPQLVRKYGAPDADLVRPTTKKAKLLAVRLLDTSSGRTMERKLPARMSVQALYGFVQKMFNIHDSINLYCVDSQRKDVRFELESSPKTLDFYSMRDGDTIVIE